MEASTSGAALNVMIRFVRPLHRHLVRAADEGLRQAGLTLPMRSVLERLYEAGPQTVPQLARALAVPRQFAQRTVDALADLGRVDRADNEAHRRSPLIRLTPGGRAVIEDVLAREADFLATVATGIDASDVEASIRVLERLSAALAGLAAAPGRGRRREPADGQAGEPVSGSGLPVRPTPPTG